VIKYFIFGIKDEKYVHRGGKKKEWKKKNTINGMRID